MLSEVVSDMPFEPFSIDHLVDQHKCFQILLDSRFPLAVKLYSYSSLFNRPRFNWHERLEINVTVTGRGRLRMGDRTLNFSSGDIIVVDNLELHGLVDYEGSVRKAVITFMPDLICNPVSYPCDSIYLRPFFFRKPGIDPVLRPDHPTWAQVDTALAKVVECYCSVNDQAHQAACKAYLLQALCGLAQHFELIEPKTKEPDTRMQLSRWFGRLHAYLQQNYSGRITVSAAASIVGMSEFQFMRFFKRATGLTFVDYLNRIRLSKAYTLLVQTDRSIADIAISVGFADQSYFDRCFRKHYSQTPRDTRRTAGLSKMSGRSF